jgi:heterodisulfide reductase subunit C
LTKKKATPKKTTPKTTPAAQKQKENPVVATSIAACPKCGCTERTKKQNVRKRDIVGKTRDGIPFTQVVWSTVTCKQCPQRYSLQEFLTPYRGGDTK